MKTVLKGLITGLTGWMCFLICGAIFEKSHTLVGAQRQRLPIRLTVDAREASRKIFHVRELIPVAPGRVTLRYPKWIPGEHGPTGPITDLAGLRLTAGGKPVAWQRDRVDMYAFHCDVPADVDTIEATFDFLSPATTEGFSSGASATSQLAVISWNQLLVYPAGREAAELTFSTSLRLSAGWKFGTALPVTRATDEQIDFTPVTLDTLVDSPVIAGAHYAHIPLSSGDGPNHLHIVGESDAALEMSPQLKAQYQHLVAEFGALFGARHYRQYHFLLTLSDYVAHFGLEHHESSDNRVPERSLVDEVKRVRMATLLPHEGVHSWNGKCRRPADIATPDFEQPMRTELLWVYEGLTEYLGSILTARSGLWTPEIYREHLALIAAQLDHRAGNEVDSRERPAMVTGHSQGRAQGGPGERRAARAPGGEQRVL